MRKSLRRRPEFPPIVDRLIRHAGITQFFWYAGPLRWPKRDEQHTVTTPLATTQRPEEGP